MGNMFCHAKISASTMYNSDGSASLADEQSKGFYPGFYNIFENKSSVFNPSQFIPKAWFEAKGYHIQMDRLYYTMIKLGPGILNILMLRPLMHRIITMFLNCLFLQPLTYNLSKQQTDI